MSWGALLLSTPSSLDLHFQENDWFYVYNFMGAMWQEFAENGKGTSPGVGTAAAVMALQQACLESGPSSICNGDNAILTEESATRKPRRSAFCNAGAAFRAAAAAKMQPPRLLARTCFRAGHLLY